jgi:hypothetical protein
MYHDAFGKWRWTFFCLCTYILSTYNNYCQSYVNTGNSTLYICIWKSLNSAGDKEWNDLPALVTVKNIVLLEARATCRNGIVNGFWPLVFPQMGSSQAPYSASESFSNLALKGKWRKKSTMHVQSTAHQENVFSVWNMGCLRLNVWLHVVIENSMYVKARISPLVKEEWLQNSCWTVT